MKATILSIAVLTVSVMLISCSDSFDGIQSVPETSEVTNASVPVPRNLVWSHDGFEIRAEVQQFVSDELLIKASKFRITDAVVSFKASTDVDSETGSGYAATVGVFGSDGEVLFYETKPSLINAYHTIYFNAENNNITLYLVLQRPETDMLCGSATIKISEIKVYSLN